MPGTPRDTTRSPRRRRSAAATSTAPILGQVTQLVSANEQLQRDNAELRAQNERLRAELADIGSALGRLTSGPRRGRGRRGPEAAILVDRATRRTRRPITDPAQLERRRLALTKARAARAAKIAVARVNDHASPDGGDE